MNRRFGSPFNLPLAASIAGHFCVLILLLLFAGQVAPLVLPPQPKPPIEIMLAPPPEVKAEPLPPLPPPPPPEKVEPPPPPPPVVKEEPPPPPVVKEEPPPPPPPRAKPVVMRPPPRREAVHTPPHREAVVMPPPVPYQPPPVPYQPPAPIQPAAVPRPPPPAPAGPVVSAGYRAALAGWLESHKRYPPAARDRGEAGQAVLRFRVERSGRVLDYAVVKSTGYAELDAAIDRMMQGATLPPFPADMSAGEVEVSVTIRFALAR